MPEVAAPVPGTTTIAVRGSSPYDVVVGEGLGDRVLPMLGADVRRVAVLFPDGLRALAEPVVAALEGAGLRVLELPLPEGEDAKTATVAVAAWDALGEAGFTRSDAVVTVGGGATTDMGGFIAATWLRGVPVVHVPTTLLGMVDAAVGGKTGMNTAAGKNLVGSFHEPAGVVCDLATLRTLPRDELVSGLGEVVKCGFIADPEILRLVESDPEGAADPASPVLAELVRRSVQVKVDVVVGDLRETAGFAGAGGHPGREALNYGHTMAHAIERAEGYTMRHGEAVAIGMVFVAELARRAGRLDDATVDRHAATLAAVGLPTGYDGADPATLQAAMKVDKKSRGDQLRFVVLDALATPRILAGPAEADLLAADAAMRGGAR
ncbi:3-dehydroquinate synthase [Nocardioides zeae]|uniref:3-dehydroquinate synthase n=1 Tax=Nocardioides imazamoxiresistens TaxID=3231893 RepID=A0ABU3PZD3_9ACTN|nr:3-dehydroquinate synthase [Nocardioides zeae]MDT9594620.1 3-dehydroquinate synthase [Nocardioides zeae]